MVIAGVYCRKSTDQSGVSDDQRSVARQIEHARAYAARKGWHVTDEHVYVDDGISGAEFAARPGFLRLMNALKPRAPFQVLVMSEESRLGREAIETAYALRQIVQAGVRVFFYLEDRERTLDSPTDKIMLSLTAFADELEREKARQRTYDAMQRKARAGHVTGGRVFGYDNVEITTPDGRRSHVERRISEGEAAIVRRIFELSAFGYGWTRITKLLNAEGVPSPRSQQGRPKAWATSSVRAVLLRSLYRGEVVWNRTKKRDTWGQKRRSDRAASEWMRVVVPELRIVSDALWGTAHGQREQRERQHTTGSRAYRPSRYLLSGFARCALCGGGFASHLRTHGTHRAYFYGCTSYWKRGESVCHNDLVGRMHLIDAEVVETLKDDVLRPSVVERAIVLALDELSPKREDERRAKLEAELAGVERECERLADAIVRGGSLDVLVSRLQARQARGEQIKAALAALPMVAPPIAREGLERRIREKLDDWRGLLTRNVDAGRDVLRLLLVEPLRFTPVVDEKRRGYRFTGTIALDRLVSGVVELPKTLTGVSSPRRTTVMYQPRELRIPLMA